MKPTYDFRSNNLSDTKRLGNAIGKLVPQGFVIGLTGTLGTGKTNLTQSIGEGLGLDPSHVVSPTYTICIPHSARLELLHLDAYRIKHDEEVDELGLDERVQDGDVLIIEWIEKIEKLAPPADLQISIEAIGDTARLFTMTAMSTPGVELIEAIDRELTE